MDYISAKEAAEKWGISPRRVVKLLSDGRVKGANLVGDRWLIPYNAQKPSDGRTKGSSRFGGVVDSPFRFPLFYIADIDSYNPSLNVEEEALYNAERHLLRCEFDEAKKALGDLPENAYNLYNKIGALYLGALINYELGNVKVTYEYYNRLNILLKQDFEHKTEMELLLLVLDLNMCRPGKIKYDFNIDQEYHYDETCMAYVTMIGVISLAMQSMDKPLKRVRMVDGYSLMADAAERFGRVNEASIMRMYLSFLYFTSGDTASSRVQIRKAFEIIKKYELYYFAGKFTSVCGDIVDVVKHEFDAEFTAKIDECAALVKGNMEKFTKETNQSNIYALLSRQDFQYIFFAVQGRRNNDVAEIMDVSIPTVCNRYSDIYHRLGVRNKREMLDMFEETVNSVMLDDGKTRRKKRKRQSDKREI